MSQKFNFTDETFCCSTFDDNHIEELIYITLFSMKTVFLLTINEKL